MESQGTFENSVASLWPTHSVSQIAVSLKTTKHVIYATAKSLGLKTHQELAEEKPSPEEIEQRAAEVRSRWTASERSRRAVGRVDRYTVPQFTSRQLFPAFQGAAK